MSEISLFLAGDVMVGRGIDQVMSHPADPVLFERWARSALEYVDLAEAVNGPIPRGVGPEYVWGDALPLLEARAPDVRIINLETAITAKGVPWPGKGIQYRMSPANADLIAAAGVDACVLANNHVLDWSYSGFEDTLRTVAEQGATPVGAGHDLHASEEPGVLERGGGARVLVTASATVSSGVDPEWAARPDRPGIAITDLSAPDIAAVSGRLEAVRAPGDLVVASIHWGPNWGYAVPDSHRRFAHQLIDNAGAHIVHGHSSHHPLGIEMYRGRLILYGCGDLINDYEGIGGHGEYRPDLGIIYLVTADPGVGILEVEMIPMQMKRFRLCEPDVTDQEWIARRLSREGERFGTAVSMKGSSLLLRW